MNNIELKKYLETDNKSGYKGVYHHCQNLGEHPWYSMITFNGSKIYLGSFSDPKNAALAYDAAAQKYYGEFSKLNFSRETQS